MTKLNIIVDNKNKNDFYFKKYFYQLIIVDNQNIFNSKREIELYFFINYIKYISVNLAF